MVKALEKRDTDFHNERRYQEATGVGGPTIKPHRFLGYPPSQTKGCKEKPLKSESKPDPLYSCGEDKIGMSEMDFHKDEV